LTGANEAGGWVVSFGSDENRMGEIGMGVGKVGMYLVSTYAGGLLAEVYGDEMALLTLPGHGALMDSLDCRLKVSMGEWLGIF